MTLIERLRSVDDQYCASAADAIEALQAENERLKEAVAEFKKPGEGDSLIGTAARILNVKLIQERDALAAKLVTLEADAERLNRIAWLIGSIFVHGNFKAETCNERELERLLRENGTFWDTLQDFDDAIDAAKGGQQ